MSNTTIAGKEGVKVDFLLGSQNFTTLVELKKPDTPLFKNIQSGKNRSRSWKLSDDFVDAISQILAQKAEWQLKSRSNELYDLDVKLISQQTVDPLTILIIGNTNQFQGDTLDCKIKAETFENFRRNQKNIQILTYDELYNRAKFIVS